MEMGRRRSSRKRLKKVAESKNNLCSLYFSVLLQSHHYILWPYSSLPVNLKLKVGRRLKMAKINFPTTQIRTSKIEISELAADSRKQAADMSHIPLSSSQSSRYSQENDFLPPLSFISCWDSVLGSSSLASRY